MAGSSAGSRKEVYRLTEKASFQAVGDGAVVLLADTGQLYSCNETTERFLSHIDGERTLAEIAEIIASQYDVEFTVATEDLRVLARQLIDEGIISATD